VTSVSAALGHAQTSTTLNIYSHYFQAAQAKVSEAIAGALNFTHKKICKPYNIKPVVKDRQRTQRFFKGNQKAQTPHKMGDLSL